MSDEAADVGTAAGGGGGAAGASGAAAGVAGGAVGCGEGAAAGYGAAAGNDGAGGAAAGCSEGSGSDFAAGVAGGAVDVAGCGGAGGAVGAGGLAGCCVTAGADERCMPAAGGGAEGACGLGADAFPVGVEPLEAFFARVPRFALAFSAGADSACLLGTAAKAGCRVKAYLVKTVFQPYADVADAQHVAAEWGVPLEVIYADVLSQPAIAANPPDRCYHCKTFIFGIIKKRAQSDGYPVLCDGTNATDNPARRPGFRALAELGVVSPLRRAGLTKDEVRALGRSVGVSLADKPSFSCYAVHAPAGQPLTEEALHQVTALFDA